MSDPTPTALDQDRRERFTTDHPEDLEVEETPPDKVPKRPDGWKPWAGE